MSYYDIFCYVVPYNAPISDTEMCNKSIHLELQRGRVRFVVNSVCIVVLNDLLHNNQID